MYFDYDAVKQPAPLFGEGFGDEARKLTTLSKYLLLETWTPLWAAMLACGIQPPKGCTEMPRGGMSLGNRVLMPTAGAFQAAEDVLFRWNSRENPPDKVRPADFVAWCNTQGINTDWLRDVLSVSDPAPKAIAESAPAAVPHGAVVAGGTAVVWTPERKAAAQATLNKHRADGKKDFAKRTADEYGVTTSRLSIVLAKKKPKPSKKRASPFPT